MTRRRRILAGAASLGLIAGLGLLGLAQPAQAQVSLTVEGNSNLQGGETITATVTGFTPNSSVAIGICPTGVALEGAGNCGPAAQGYASLGVTDDDGTATAELQVPEPGPLGNTVGDPADCPPCSVAAANIQDASEAAEVELNYAAAADDGADDNGTDDADDNGAAPAPSDSSDDTIAQTGPRETLILALVALAVLQIGLLLTVRSVRAGRRVAGS